MAWLEAIVVGFGNCISNYLVSHPREDRTNGFLPKLAHSKLDSLSRQRLPPNDGVAVN